MATTTIPSSLLKDRYWAPMLYLFQENDKLNTLFTTKYFDFDERTVKIQALQRACRGWSRSEVFMLKLAMHCFNDRNKVDLGDMDYLDHENTNLAFEALKMRYTSSLF